MLLNEQEQTTALHRTADQTAIGIEAYTADAAGVLWRSGRAYIPPADPFIPLSPQFITLVQNGMIVDAQRDAAAIVGRLEAHSTAQMKEIDFARATAVARIDQEISRRLHDLTRFDAARIKFMGVLSGTTFVNGLLTLVVSLSALSAFVDQIDEHLPAPLYHSVARMTRVVVWETKQALELSGSMQEIKWQLVGRNDQGGITLKGVQPPPAGLEGRRAAAACRFTIESDRFGRIIQAQRTELPAPAAGAAADLDDLFRPQGRVERPSVAVRVTPRPFG